MIDLKEKAFKRNPNQNFGPIAMVVRLEDALAAVEEAVENGNTVANNYGLTLHEVAQQLGVNWCGDADNDAVMEAARKARAALELVKEEQV